MYLCNYLILIGLGLIVPMQIHVYVKLCVWHIVIQFLTGLNDQFSVVKTQMLLMDPLPSINKVYSLVMQESNDGFIHHLLLTRGMHAQKYSRAQTQDL
jgi:hypothetical protein